MQFDELLASITPETFERLLQAVELGRWPDGAKLSEEQRANSIQLVMAYQARYRPSDEPFRIGSDGQLVTRSKREMKADLTGAGTIASFSLNDN
ncbi:MULTISPECIES: YeaC family protein [Idiomarinaceae]|uniref:DUF1315 family protein n=4 Tax=Pseudidiomarina TaxID=2800384 RepID=A0A368V1Y4_9GAMM|nr:MULTISPECIES: DUF1315 family protein [Idiomarinaceae]MDT7524943.1 DUF1315 family protein [Pseudidiomarina sp. GXY010]MDX1525073.1 DUF1315 family protein [Pseudidiomarina maritima]MRJ40854.1 DUF1315 family protein [Idiomarina sp. FeN1]NCU56658.1 DUF1315 family protein [Idiomarina sp. FenA--70]NCU59038.1 DUF1315 family protein [Idiomarina sp. FenBw--71]